MRFMLRHGADRRALRAFAERQELVKAGLTRRDLVKMGVLSTGGVGRLVAAPVVVPVLARGVTSRMPGGAAGLAGVVCAV